MTIGRLRILWLPPADFITGKRVRAHPWPHRVHTTKDSKATAYATGNLVAIWMSRAGEMAVTNGDEDA